MTTLHNLLISQGATLAPDGIPLHFGDQKAEYDAARNQTVVMLRSHETRLELTGKDRLTIMHRISTNDLMNMQIGEGRPTIFTNPVARILDRVMVYHHADRAVLLGEPGRSAALAQYLQRNIFFNDEARLTELTATTHQFDVHGPQADAVVRSLAPEAESLPALHSLEMAFENIPVFMARRKPVVGQRWTFVVPAIEAERVWAALVERGSQPAGSLTYNVLRIAAGIPGAGRELSQDYIPLEVGLWDEVSFTKGCYTGQEILARMESRNRLANTIVKLQLESMVEAPAEIHHDGHPAGRLTSSVVSPDGEIFAIAVIKTRFAQLGQSLRIGETPANVLELIGVQPNRAESQLN